MQSSSFGFKRFWDYLRVTERDMPGGKKSFPKQWNSFKKDLGSQQFSTATTVVMILKVAALK